MKRLTEGWRRRMAKKDGEEGGAKESSTNYKQATASDNQTTKHNSPGNALSVVQIVWMLHTAPAMRLRRR